MGKRYTRTTRRARNYGYGDAGASGTRRAFKQFRSLSGSPHQDIDRHNSTLRSRARSLYMSAPMATSAIKSLRTSVVGPGLYLHAQVDGKYLGLTKEETTTLNNEIEAEFELWAGNKRSASVTGLSDFYELQQIAIMAWKTSGDVFCLFEQGKPDWLHPYSLRLRLIEADRVSTPGTSNVIPYLTFGMNKTTGNKIFDGVEVDRYGQVVAYHIRNVYPQEISVDETEWIRVEAVGKRTLLPNILHIMEAERPEQYRGVTCLAPVIENILQLGRYLNAEEAASLLETCLTIFVKTDVDSDGVPLRMPTEAMSEETEQSEDDRDPADYELVPGGNVAFLKPGEDITSVDPKRPSTAFDGFVTSVAKQIGAALEIPVDVLIKSFNSSYSASRAALQDYWRKVKNDRISFAGSFNAPVYEVFLSEAIARGRIHAPGFFSDARIRAAYLNHEWNGPAMTHLDPEKEARAMKIMVENGWKTNTQATTELTGGDYLKNIEQLASETPAIVPILAMLADAVAAKKEESSSQQSEKEDINSEEQ